MTIEKEYVWIVSYISSFYVNGRWEDDVFVTPFNNEEAAIKMYKYYDGKIDYRNVCIDKCEVFSNFLTSDDIKNMKLGGEQ